MTLKELFLKVDFDNIYPDLEECDDVNYGFREAYDILCRMEPIGGEEKEIHVSRKEIFLRNHGGEMERVESIDVNLHGSAWCWGKNLAKEIVVTDDACFSDEELAICFLWELSGNVFLPEEFEKSFERFKRCKPAGPYETALDKLEESIWRHQIPRQFRCRGENGERYTTDEGCRFMVKRNLARKNRSKRKRDYRQDKRRRDLWGMIDCKNAVAFLASEGSIFKRSDVDFLWDVEYLRHFDYISVTNNAEGRLDYILESMTRYQEIPEILELCNNAIVLVCVPACSPLDEAELEKFKEAVRLHLGYDDILFGLKTEERQSHHLEVFLLLNQSTRFPVMPIDKKSGLYFDILEKA